MVFVGDAVVICEGFGEPVGGTDEGCFCVDVLGICQIEVELSLRGNVGDIFLTSARCCWPVAKVLSLRAVGVLLPLVAKSGVLMSTEALVDG